MNNYNWWKEDKFGVADSVQATVNAIRNGQSTRESTYLDFARLYGNCAILGLSPSRYARIAPGKQYERLTLNVVQSIIDTLSAKIGKNKPRPTFLTSGGDWALRQKAKGLSKFCEGVFYKTKAYELGRDVFRDACVFGTGVLKIFRDGNEIKFDRVAPTEIFIDDIDGYYMMPRQMHQIKYIHKDILSEMFPGKNIEDTDVDAGDPIGQINSSNVRMVKVVESWHLPSGEDAKDGRHIITTKSQTLLDEKYTDSYFPFVFLRWSNPLFGFWGQGVTEQILSIQLEINKLLRVIQDTMHIFSIPKLFVPKGTKLNLLQLNNNLRSIIEYTGVMPEVKTFGSVPSDLFIELDKLFNKAFEIVGLSVLSSQSKLPPNIESKIAIREYNDIETERFGVAALAYEEFFMEIAKRVVRLGKDIAKDDPDFSVNVKGDKFLKTIKWTDVDLDEDAYMLQVFPTSILPSTPSGKLDMVQVLIDGGYLTKESAFKLLNFPDLEDVVNLQRSAMDDIEETINKIVEDGEYSPPDEFQNLQLGITMFQQSYLKYRHEGLPEERLEMLRQWATDAAEMLAPPAPPEGEGAPPPMPGEALPPQLDAMMAPPVEA